jgi:hypothetical protein
MAANLMEVRVMKVFDDMMYTKKMHAPCAQPVDGVLYMAAAKGCPECGAPIIPEGRCAYCPVCGFASCGV